jgi:D-beta-D-heptose 7-phosphate kinase/D-beta-D-heptose 1-phosphate adenosyltransferase
VTQENLGGKFAASDPCRVLCVGDLMLDRFVYGDVNRISPEAPIPVIRIGEETTMPGGAGNVVRNIAALGDRTCFLSVVGDDKEGRTLTELIGNEALIEPCILSVKGRPTTVKTRYLADGQQLFRADKETTQAISRKDAAHIGRVISDTAADVDVIAVSDYAKGFVTDDLLAELVRSAHAARKPLVIDPKGFDFSRYRGASVLTPNRHELAHAVQGDTDDDASVGASARKIIDKHEIGAVLVTRSEQGMSLVTESSVHHLSAEAKEVFDVSGAGDTVLATFCAALGRGLSLLDSARLANLAAGIVVGKVGTAVVFQDDLVRASYTSDWSRTEAKIVSLAAAKDQVKHWRRAGQRVAFTNGCFDLLHPGHVAMLNGARSAADRLVVGLNSDESVCRLKGPDRPVQSETARAQVLASLSSVDLVVVFGEDTPLMLINGLRPDVLAKGADYRVEDVVGADIVKEYGGKVLLVPLTPGHSTSNTIARVVR